MRRSRGNQRRAISRPVRFRGLCVETLEDRRLLTAASSLDSATLIDSGPEGENGSVPFINGQLLVQFKAGTSASEVQQILTQEQSTIAQTFYGLDNLVLVNLPWYSSQRGTVPQYATTEAARSWSTKPQVQYVQTNRIAADTEFIPDDTLFPFQCAMHNTGQTGGIIDSDIDATEAWDIFTGSKQTVVAVIDTGVTYIAPRSPRQHVGQSG